MVPIDFTNYQNNMCTFNYRRSKHTSKITFETLLSSLSFKTSLRNLVDRHLQLSGKERIVW